MTGGPCRGDREDAVRRSPSFRAASKGPRESRSEALAQTARETVIGRMKPELEGGSSGSAGRSGRAGHLPQRGERVLRSQDQGARASRSRDRRRPGGVDLGGRVDHRVGRMDQRPDARAAVPGAVSEDLRADVDRGHREIPRFGNDPRDRPRLREEARPGVRREGVRHDRDGAGSSAGGRGHRPGSRESALPTPGPSRRSSARS